MKANPLAFALLLGLLFVSPSKSIKSTYLLGGASSFLSSICLLAFGTVSNPAFFFFFTSSSEEELSSDELSLESESLSFFFLCFFDFFFLLSTFYPVLPLSPLFTELSLVDVYATSLV